jgi:4-methylaminobutanoate oxidase (formaldehyde-forming)
MHLDDEETVSLRDITTEWACLALWGPKARSVLSKVTQDNVTNEAFPYLAGKFITINGARVWAQRVSYVGELGWELYIPNNRASMVWDLLRGAGKGFGMEVGGYKVLDSLRLEKGYRYYTTDVTQLETPFEGGLGFCVHFDKGDGSTGSPQGFIGKEALLEKKEKGFATKLCTLVLDGEDFTQVYGGEAIYHGGKVLTRVRSGGYGYTVKKNILLAYLPIELAKTGTPVQVELIEGMRMAKVTASVLYDPKGEKLKT